MLKAKLTSLKGQIKRQVSTTLFARRLSEDILYWHRSRLYWEGVLHPDGGDQEDQANIHLAEGGTIAVRRIAHGLGIHPATLPEDEMARALARLTLRLHLDEWESDALKTLERLGPSIHIPVSERIRDHIDACEAEETLGHSELIREYLAWLNNTEDPDDTQREDEETPEADALANREARKGPWN